jgi:hypothetical protein
MTMSIARARMDSRSRPKSGRLILRPLLLVSSLLRGTAPLAGRGTREPRDSVSDVGEFSPHLPFSYGNRA